MSLAVTTIMVGAKEELNANGDEDELRLRAVSLYNITIHVITHQHEHITVRRF